MATAANAASVKVTGTSTAFTDEACANTTGDSYQITDATKRILDPDVAVVVYDDGTPVDAADILSYDPLFGIVTFQGAYTVIGDITMDGSYLPTYTLVGAYEYTFMRAADLLDVTAFEDSDSRVRIAGLDDYSASITVHDDSQYDLDGGGITLSTIFADQTPVVLEIAAASKTFRAWTIIESLSNDPAVDGVVDTDVAFSAHTTLFVTDDSDVSWASA